MTLAAKNTEAEVERQRSTTRNLGLLLALSTPITMFVSYAFFAVLFGEEHFEDEQGATDLGIATWILPLVIGLVIAGWAHFGGRLPSLTAVSNTLALVGVLCVAVGAFSVSSSDSASIGGAFLVLFGVSLGVVAWAVRNSASKAAEGPPPPRPIPQ